MRMGELGAVKPGNTWRGVAPYLCIDVPLYRQRWLQVTFAPARSLARALQCCMACGIWFGSGRTLCVWCPLFSVGKPLLRSSVASNIL